MRRLTRFRVAWAVLRGHGVAWGLQLVVCEHAGGRKVEAAEEGVIGVISGRDKTKCVYVLENEFFGDWRTPHGGVLLPCDELNKTVA